MLNKVLVPVTLDNDFVKYLNLSWFPGKLGVEHFHLLHVLSGGLGCTEEAARILGKSVKEIAGKGIRSASYEVAHGHAATEIVTKAKEGLFDLIMIPANNKNILVRMMLGSTATEVIRMTDTPVLILKSGLPELNTVLYATDFEEAASKALEYVRFLGKIGAKLIIQHVGTRAADPQAEAKREEYVCQKLEEIKKDLDLYWSEISTHSSLGTPSRTIAAVAKESGAGLLVLGKGNKGILKKILGSTAEKVTNNVGSSVFIVL